MISLRHPVLPAKTKTPIAAMLVGLLAATVFSDPAHSQDYPAKPVRIIVPLAAGVMSDIFARRAAQRRTEVGRQPFIFENRVGAGGNIGAEFAAKAVPDGHTLYMGFHGSNAINPILYGAKLGFDPFKDFVPVILVT